MEFTIRKGKHSSFKSVCKHTKIIRSKKFRKIKVDVEVLPNSVYPTQGDVDLLGDWSKLPGVSGFIWPSNKTFVTLGFRTNSKGNLEVTPYANLNSKVNEKFPHETGDIFIFTPGDKFYYEIELQEANLIVSIFTGENTLITSKVFETKDLGRFIRTTSFWFGGYDNDSNNLGGIAPSNVSFKFTHILHKH